MRIALDHVQVIAPAGGTDDARGFYAGLIGLEEIAPPETMGGTGAWFRVGSQELHVSEHEPFAPARKAHPAFELEGRELDDLGAKLESAGFAVQWDERLPGARRFYAADPAGNRLEFLTRA